MAIEVIKPGLSTTVQDLGRPGYYHIGIPLSGGMDRLALRAANLLVGNREDAAVLEAVFLGPELEFTEDASVAVTGAEIPPKVNGEIQPTWTSFKIKKGQLLSFEYLKKGARAYIAVSGGIDVPSCSGRVRLMRLAHLAVSRAASSRRVIIFRWERAAGRGRGAAFQKSFVVYLGRLPNCA
jgi:allophanate hydrolase subunit 2